METVSIYVLIDPRDNEIRYVGKTERKLPVRLRDHIKESRSGKRSSWRNYWIAKLLRLGYQPSIQLVQAVPKTIWRSAEAYWIQYYWSIGCRLTNGTTGGDGHDHFTEVTRAKMADAAIRKFQDPAIKAKYLGNQNSLGRVLSDSERAKTTARNFARYGLPWERLADDYERLGTCEKVAAEYGCNPESVRRALKRTGIAAHGINLQSGEHTQEFLEFWAHLAEDYKQLGTQQAVGDLYGVSAQRVGKAMRTLGVEAYPRAGRTHQWTPEWRATHKAAVSDPEFQRRRIETKQRNATA